MSLRSEGDPTARFSDRVADYERFRPTYPAAAIDAVLDGLDPPVAAADIGAGTGISARLLADRGVTVHAIEPNDAMREAGMRNPRFTHGGAGVSPARVDLPPVTARLQKKRRNLPHWEQGGCIYFVTFRTRSGDLSEAERRVVLDACLHWHDKKAIVHLVTVMPDHVHLLLTPLSCGVDQWYSLPELMQSIKSFTAHKIGKMRDRPGSIWQEEYFDRIVRDADEFTEKWNYMLKNPVKAGLVEREWDYEYTQEPDCGRDARTTGRINWINATGEHTSLPDDSVDLILCAQAYHWLEPEAAATEFLRIRKSGGRIALMWNDWNEASPVAAAYAKLIRTHVPTLPEHHDSTAPVLSGRLSLVWTRRFEHAQRLDRDGLIGRAMSASYIPKSGPAHDAVMRGLEAIHDQHADADGVVDLGLETLVFFVEP